MLEGGKPSSQLESAQISWSRLLTGTVPATASTFRRRIDQLAAFSLRVWEVITGQTTEGIREFTGPLVSLTSDKRLIQLMQVRMIFNFFQSDRVYVVRANGHCCPN